MGVLPGPDQEANGYYRVDDAFGENARYRSRPGGRNTFVKFPTPKA
jgi:hypothetical protein